jgi:hypothetical protein
MKPRTVLAALAAAPLALALGLPATAVSTADAPDVRRVPSRVLDVSDLPTGEPPAIAWSERRGGRITIHGASGGTPVPGELQGFAPMGSGYVVQLSDPDRNGARPLVSWIGADGSPGRSTWRSSYGLAVSAQGRAVAFAVRRGGVRVIDSEGDRVLRMPSVPIRGIGAVAAVSGEDCKESATSTGCAVMVNSNRRQVSWVVSSHGIVDATGFRVVTTGRGRWTGGIVRLFDAGSCSRMERGSRTRWRTCRNQFSDIAPGNGHVIGTPAYADGFGPTSLDVLDLRTGDRVRSWRAARDGSSATYFDEVWEDPEHLLVVTFQDREWAVVRLGLDGTMEYAVPPRRGSDLRRPFLLQTR